MKRAHLLSVIAILLAAVAAVGAARAVAQDGTPTVEPVAIETLARGVPAGTGGRTLLLQRIVIQPGVEIPSHQHPADLVYVIESGTFSFTVLEGSVELTRRATGATETVAVGTEVVLEAGDAMFEGEGAVHVARNAGPEPVVILLAGVVDEAQPFIQPVEPGTPTT
jgi:quercetin dioxygenase-like cupin family protein